MNIAIIGAGAAGCFAAINLKRLCPQAAVTIYESGRRPLAKVSVTGGGRCNLTNTFEGVKSADEAYPRGARLMRRLLRHFSQDDAMRWFESEGVRLTVQSDHCVFPASQDAMEIVGTLLRLVRRLGISLITERRVARISRCDGTGGGAFRIEFAGGGAAAARADMVLVATGGTKASTLREMLAGSGAEIEDTVPSLFSLCLADAGLRELAGTVVKDATAAISGTKHKVAGPLLVTHWGVSGPAILKLSARAARHLHGCGYQATLSVNWNGGRGEAETMETLAAIAADCPKRQLASAHPPQIGARLWQHLLVKSCLRPDCRWGETGRKSLNKLVSTLTNDTYAVSGKCRFKEEFVTCGGVSLASVSASTMECKTCPGLFFAGEATDIDGITGGFNLQAAWTTARVAAEAMAARCAAGRG